MRLAGLGLSLALAAAFPGAARAQVSTAPLAQGEILLQTSGLGEVTTPGDRAVLSLLVSANGTDNAAARQTLRTKLDRVNAGLRAAGVGAADVETGGVNIGVNYAALPSDLMIAAAAQNVRQGTSPLAEPGTAVNANIAMIITFRDVSKIEAVRDLLAANEVEIYSQPQYSLADDEPQRRQARAQALQRARADAENYAATLNLRVVRIVRVTERLGLDGLGLLLSDGLSWGRLFGRQSGLSSNVEVMVAVGVDFALAPR